MEEGVFRVERFDWGDFEAAAEASCSGLAGLCAIEMEGT